VVWHVGGGVGRGADEGWGSLRRDFGGARGVRGLRPGPLAAPSTRGRTRGVWGPAHARHAPVGVSLMRSYVLFRDSSIPRA
jgi:hypothetical protein